MLERPINPPLTINVHIIDNASDNEEKVNCYHLKRVDDTQSYKDALKQQAALDRKWKVIQNLIIWAMNNGKTLEFVLASEDSE